jgi:hypothetical protein
MALPGDLADEYKLLPAVASPAANYRSNFNCLVPKITGGGFTQSGTTINVSTTITHGLNPGDQVYIDFVAGQGTDATYTVVTVPDLTHFTVTAPSSVNQTQNGQVLFPLAAPAPDTLRQRFRSVGARSA